MAGDFRANLRRAHRTTAIVVGALVGTLGVYAVVVEVIRATSHPFTGIAPFPGLDTLRYVLYALGAAQVLVVRLLRGRLLEGATSGNRAAVLATLQTAAIVTAALAEIPAIFGLILFLIGGAVTDFYLLAGWSLLLQLAHVPRHAQWHAQWEEWARAHGAEHTTGS